MIKYPVKVETDPEINGYVIYDANNDVVVVIEQHTIDLPADVVSDTIASALNAMHEFPTFNHPKYFDEIVK